MTGSGDRTAPDGPAGLLGLLGALAEDPDVVRIVEEEPLAPSFADADLHPLLRARLAERGVDRLYRHQAEALTRVRAGEHTVVASGTASGKSLVYQVPVVESALADPHTTTLLLHPTKALSHDQLRSLRALRIPELRLGVYDGDTPPDERVRIRRSANVVLTNPDMVHVGILPAHDRWATFLHRLRYVVVDEMHAFRGIFGTHVGLVLRRLRRLASHYGAEPVFILSSATIGNPGELASALTGLDVAVVDRDTSGRGRRWLALVNPPLDERGRRRSALAAATDILVELVTAGVSTILFARTRRGTELVYRWARDRLPPSLADRVAPYRSGYLPAERRETERRLFAGDLSAVVATSALELGIDIGGLDAAVLATFPGTVSSFRQQAGRVGRRGLDALVVLVAGEDALDQYVVDHPAHVTDGPAEPAVVNPGNPFVAEAHTACAAYELPLSWDDRETLGEAVEEAANRLVQEGKLRLSGDRLHWVGRRRPAPTISIRAGGGEPVDIVHGARVIETLDEARATREAHLGAVFLNRGEAYVVVDRRPGTVLVEPAPGDVYTEPREESTVDILGVSAESRVADVRVLTGPVRVTTTVSGYRRLRSGSRRVLGHVDLVPVTTVLETAAVSFIFPPGRLAGLPPRRAAGSLHAAEHAAIGLLPLLAVCDRGDVGGLSTARHPATGAPTIIIHEAYPGGAGISPLLFGAAASHLRTTREAIERCPCAAGCPACVVSPKCGSFNAPLDKAGAVHLLAGI